MKKARAMYIPAGGKTAVWGPVDQNVLPEGVPFVKTVYDEWGTVTVLADAAESSYEATFYDNEGNIRVIEAGKKYRAIFDGKEYICTGADKTLYTWFSADGSNAVSETCPFYFKTTESAANHRKLYVYEAGQHTFSVAEIVEEVHPIDKRCLPKLTSPNGTNYQLTVADDGTLSAVAVS